MNGAQHTMQRDDRVPMLEEREASLRDYLDLLRRRYWIIFSAFAITLGAAIGLSMARVPVYRASTTLVTDKTPPLVLLNTAGEEFSFFPDRAAAQAPDVHTLTELISSEVVQDGAVARLTPTLGPEVAGAAVGGMSVRPVENAQLVRVFVQYTEPSAAALAANAIAESVIDMNLKARRKRVTETRQFINTQLGSARVKLRASEAAEVAFKNRHGNVSLAQDTRLKIETLAALEAQRVDVRLPRLEEQSLAVGLQRQLATLEIDLHGLRRSFTEKHPAVITTEAKIAETKRRLEDEVDRSRKAEQSREQAILAAIKQYESQVRDVPPREAELVRLTRDLKEAEQIYLLLSTKLQQALIAEASIGSSIQVVDVAKVPGAPETSGGRKIIILGSVLGLMMGMGAALVIEQLDDTVKSPEEVEQVLGAPVLGAIPQRERGRGGSYRPGGRVPPFLVQLDHQSPEAEAYRALRTHVLSSLSDAKDACQCLLITSALPGEGKSTIAANLALALTRTNRQVWLLDCDLRHSSLSGLFPEAASPGLATFLTGSADVDDTLRSVGHPGLSFVGSGPSVANPAELLGVQRMARLMVAARARADVVLLDTPAILPVADAEVVGSLVDGVVVVVKVGKTDHRALTQARQQLDRLGVPVVGAVLNFVPAENRGRYYNTHYHAYYSPEGGRSEDPPAVPL